jgi:hypothetical protein
MGKGKSLWISIISALSYFDNLPGSTPFNFLKLPFMKLVYKTKGWIECFSMQM